MKRTDASKHQAAINRAIRAKRAFTILGFTGKKFIGVEMRGIPNFMPHMEAIIRALKAQREFFVYSDHEQRYLTADELATYMEVAQ